MRYRRPMGDTVISVLKMEMSLTGLRSYLQQEITKEEKAFEDRREPHSYKPEGSIFAHCIDDGGHMGAVRAMRSVLERMDMDPMQSGCYENQCALVLVAPDKELPGEKPRSWRTKQGEVLWHDGGMLSYELSDMGIDTWDDGDWPTEPGIYFWRGSVSYHQSGGYEYPHEYDTELNGAFSMMPIHPFEDEDGGAQEVREDEQ